MRCRFWVMLMIGFSLLVNFAAAVSGVEKLDRGLVAVEREDGSVFLSWRLLDTDGISTAFKIVRRSPEDRGSQPTDLTGKEPYYQTNFIDKSPERDTARKAYVYELLKYCPTIKSVEGRAIWIRAGEVAVVLTGRPKPYISVLLKGNYDFQKVGIADLDGDGSYEFIIKQPNFNTDPYQQPGYWKRSTTTYKLEAYRLDGTMMWRYDMGWSIEANNNRHLIIHFLLLV